MELIQHDGLEEVSLFLTDLVVGSYRLNGTVEAFTSRYRKPAKIGRRNNNHNHNNSKEAEGERKARNSNKRVEHTAGVPSYLRTGLLVDCESGTGSSTGPSPTPMSSSESDSATPSEAFTASLSFSAQEMAQPIGSTVFVAPRRQRSFSLTSCYAMRKHGRRRSSSLDNLSEPSSRLLLLDMVAALSDAFPDYDFADTKKEQFREMDLSVVVRHVNSCLTELMLRDPDAVVRLWRAIDEVVNLKHCEIFHYAPKEDEDADNFLWAFHFFFFNKDSHTLCYFACNAESVLRTKLDSINEEEDDSSDMDCCDAYDDESPRLRARDANGETEEDDFEERKPPGPFDEGADEDDEVDENMPDWDGII